MGGLVGSAVGAVGGLLGGGKEGGSDAGNLFGTAGYEAKDLKNIIFEAMRQQRDLPESIKADSNARETAKQIQENPLLAGLFGKGGLLESSTAEAQDLAKRGYQLKPEDYEAYGQASGNIARMFDKSEQSLAQALAARGLDASSAIAGREFAGSQGNKMEQLAQLQRNIADDRMKRNMERLAQTRGFAAQLGGQAQQELQSQFGRNVEGHQQRMSGIRNQAEMARNWLQSAQEQSNQQFGQQRATEGPSGLSRAFGGALLGAHAGTPGGLSSAFGGLASGIGGLFKSAPVAPKVDKVHTNVDVAKIDPFRAVS